MRVAGKLLFAGSAVLALAGAGCASTPAPVAQQQAATDVRTLKSIRSRNEAEALETEAYQRTTRWWFPGAEGFYRDLSSAELDVAGAERTVAAKVGLAVVLANQGRLDEATGQLDEAEKRVSELGGTGTLRARVALGRAITAGQRALRASGPASTAAFEASLAHSRAAVAAVQDGGTSSAASATVDPSGAVVISPLAAARYNDTRGRGDLGSILRRPMTEGERAAILRAHGHHLQAAALAGLGRFEEADAADVASLRALDGAPRQATPWLRAQLPAHRAQIALEAGDAARSEALFEEAHDYLKTTTLTGTRLEAALLRGKARAQMARGDRAAAKASSRASFEVLAAQVDGEPIPRSEVDDYLSLLAPAAASGDAKELAEYVRASSLAVETATARTMAGVAAQFSAGDNEQAAAIRRLQETDAALKRARARLAAVNRADSDATADEKAFAEAEERSRRADYETAQERARAFGSRVEAVLNDPVSLEQVQQALAPEEAYVRYIFVGGRLHAWVATRERANLYLLPVAESEAGALVDGLRRLVRTVAVTDAGGTTSQRLPPYNLTRARTVYERLVAPLEPALGSAKRVVIEPAGPLFSLPFAALVSAPLDADIERRRTADIGDYTGVKWLGNERAIRLSPGTNAFLQMRKAKPSQAANPLLAFADPQPSVGPGTGSAEIVRMRQAIGGGNGRDPELCVREDRVVLGFAPLPDTSAEANAVAQALGAAPGTSVVSGGAFTDVAVKQRQDLAGYKILYFATHGMLPNRFSCWPDPLLSTSVTEGGDGALDAREIAALSLDADLVVLSACDTAGAGAADDPQGAGQALGGLAQSFAFAGSRGLLVSHWAVNSQATSQLMSTLFRVRGGGGGTAEALATAQTTLRNQAETSHPYYWAAFTLVGEGGDAPLVRAEAPKAARKAE
ncbi:MAG TPA: CHAT domain-containing protein [Caulobacteraceae bacterium]